MPLQLNGYNCGLLSRYSRFDSSRGHKQFGELFVSRKPRGWLRRGRGNFQQKIIRDLNKQKIKKVSQIFSSSRGIYRQPVLNLPARHASHGRRVRFASSQPHAIRKNSILCIMLIFRFGRLAQLESCEPFATFTLMCKRVLYTIDT